MRWLYSTDARDIGVLYLLLSFFNGMLGTILSLAIRLQLMDIDQKQILSLPDSTYNNIITVHTILMVFFLVMPAMFGGFGNLFLPTLIGALDMSFPRLNNVSFWLLFSSLILAASSMIIGVGIGTGWTVYPPLSGVLYHSGYYIDLAIFSLHIASISSILGSINYIVTVANLRSPGISYSTLNLYVWSLVITAFLLFLACKFLPLNTINLSGELLNLNFLGLLKNYKPKLNYNLSFFNFLKKYRSKRTNRGLGEKRNLKELLISNKNFYYLINSKSKKVTLGYNIKTHLINIGELYNLKNRIGGGTIKKNLKKKEVIFIINNKNNLLSKLIDIYKDISNKNKRSFFYDSFKEIIIFEKCISIKNNNLLDKNKKYSKMEKLLRENYKFKNTTYLIVILVSNTGFALFYSANIIFTSLLYCDIISMYELSNLIPDRYISILHRDFTFSEEWIRNNEIYSLDQPILDTRSITPEPHYSSVIDSNFNIEEENLLKLQEQEIEDAIVAPELQNAHDDFEDNIVLQNPNIVTLCVLIIMGLFLYSIFDISVVDAHSLNNNVVINNNSINDTIHNNSLENIFKE